MYPPPSKKKNPGPASWSLSNSDFLPENYKTRHKPVSLWFAKCLNIWKYADVGYQMHSSRGLTHILATGECQIASWSKISQNSKKSARGIFGVNKADPIGYNFLSPQSWFRCVPWLVCSQDTCLTSSTFTVTHVVKKKNLKTGFKYQPPRKVFWPLQLHHR